MSDDAAAAPGTLAGQVAVVTGGGQGIGRAIALRCAAEGADVVLAARSTENLEQVAKEVEQIGRRALVVPTDLRRPADLERLQREAADRFGHVDMLVCNSGIAGPTAELWKISVEDWEEAFRVNVTGTFLTCRAFLPGMLERERGNVVVIGSMTGKRPLYGRTPYTASKLALVGLVRTLAWETGPSGVRVNLVSPGGTEGPRIQRVLEGQAQARGITVEEARAEMSSASPVKRLVQPDDIAGAVIFLASPASAGVTGEDLNVSAGVVMF